MAIDWSLTTTVIITILTYSILYKYTVLFRFVEYTSIGILTSYTFIITLRGFINTTWLPLTTKGDILQIFPIFLGFLLLTRLSKGAMWISKYPMSLIVGVATGVSVRTALKTLLIDQILGMQISLAGMTTLKMFNTIIMVVLTITTITFFLFTIERGKILSPLSTIGRAGLMLSFGALFGATIMSRMALVIGVIHTILKGWLGL